MDGTAIDWPDRGYAEPDLLRNRTVRCPVDAPLVRVAFLDRARVAGVTFSGSLGSAHTRILWDEIGAWRGPGAGPDAVLREPMLANACSPDGFRRAARLGARGFGLVRGEFLLAVAAGALLDERLPGGQAIAEAVEADGEWRTVVQLMRDDRLRHLLAEQFSSILDAAGAAVSAGSLIFVRCFDYGDAYSATAGGQRGTALLLTQLPQAVAFLARILAEVQARHPARFVLGLPLVSSYAELTESLAIAARAGVRFATAADDLTKPGFGWEIETPAACLCTGLWFDQLRDEYGITPAACGIGTNDLTQFTLARPRNAAVAGQRPESHPAVLALLTRLAVDADRRGLRAVLSGVAGEDPGYRAFSRELGFLVSCPIPALAATGGARPVRILDQAVAADQLNDQRGVAEVIGLAGR